MNDTEYACITGLCMFSMAVAVAIFSVGCAPDYSTIPADAASAADAARNDTSAADVRLAESCTLDADCDHLVTDRTGCMAALCDFGFCVLRQQAAGHPCNDGSSGTVSDMCQQDGTCRGTVATCGDKKCDLERENCFTCPSDCDCGPGMLCYDSECISKPEDGDGVCEKLEDCGTSPQDCECDDGFACVDAACMKCDEACAQDFRKCGEFRGCDCGECKGGLECDENGYCVVPGECGDGQCLSEFETCATCPDDCGCGSGYGCTAGICRACSTICRGIKCGDVDGCNCGDTGICEKCVDGTLVKDCACMCATEGRECGTVGDCTCGGYGGGCMDRMTCEAGLCMPDCDKVCDDYQCGAVGNCLCARCPGTQLCYDAACITTAFDEDEYEPDNYVGEAAFLGEFTDADGTPEWDVAATMLTADDRDWYQFTVEDTWGEVLYLSVVLDGMSEDADLNMMVCYRCDYGALKDPGLSPYDDAFETASTIDDARCFESRRKWGQAEAIALSPSCGGGFDDSGTVFIKIFPASKADAKTDYLLGFRL